MTVAGDDADADNVVAFPAPPGKQALYAALNQFKWRRYHRARSDPVGWLIAANKADHYPDVVWQTVADHLVWFRQAYPKRCAPYPREFGEIVAMAVSAVAPEVEKEKMREANRRRHSFGEPHHRICAILPSGQLIDEPWIDSAPARLPDDDDDEYGGPNWTAMIHTAMQYPELYSRWELRFLRSVKYYRYLTDRQCELLEALYDRAIGEKNTR